MTTTTMSPHSHFFSGWRHWSGGWTDCRCPPRRYCTLSYKILQNREHTGTLWGVGRKSPVRRDADQTSSLRSTADLPHSYIDMLGERTTQSLNTIILFVHNHHPRTEKSHRPLSEAFEPIYSADSIFWSVLACWWWISPFPESEQSVSWSTSHSDFAGIPPQTRSSQRGASMWPERNLAEVGFYQAKTGLWLLPTIKFADLCIIWQYVDHLQVSFRIFNHEVFSCQLKMVGEVID